MTHAGLFSGIDGFGLAAQWMGWKNLFHCDINPFARKISKYYWPKAISYENIITTDFHEWLNRVFVLSGGFPCQPFSTAGNRKGADDGRYLWPEYLRAIRQLKPVAILGENVSGILSMAQQEVFARVDSKGTYRYQDFDRYEAVYTRQEEMLVYRICEDLAKEGYSVQTFAIPAAGVGAPHKRERIWFAAYSASRGRTWERPAATIKNGKKEPGKVRKLEGRFKGFQSHGVIAHTNSNVHPRELAHRKDTKKTEGSKGTNQPQKEESHGQRLWAQSGPGSQALTNPQGKRLEGQHYQAPGQFGFNGNPWSEFPTQPPVCGRNDGLPSQLDGITVSQWRSKSIEGYGNAVSPYIPYLFYQTFWDMYHQQINPV